MKPFLYRLAASNGFLRKDRTTAVCLFVAAVLLSCDSGHVDYPTAPDAPQGVFVRPDWKPIDGDKPSMAVLGREAMDTLGYEEIIKRAEKAGWVTTVRVERARSPTGKVFVADAATAQFVKVFTEYAFKAGVVSQLDSPAPGPGDAVAVGILVFGLIYAGYMAHEEIVAATASAVPTATATTTTTSPPIAVPGRCLPCLPVPVGGTSYRYDSVAEGKKPHYGMANHTHHFKMHQSPPAKGCRCFWDPDFIHPTPEFSPLPGAVPVSTPGGGGIAP